jgi:glutamate-1-semialdehyde 2,1-aminomutase
MHYGEGAKFYDVDGNAYTDYCLSWGALILGHGHKDVVTAVKRAVQYGTSFGTTARPEVDIAQHIVRCVPSIDMVRFVNSGTEATMSAIRLARGFTQKKMIVKFDGCYHGHFDDLLAKAGSGVAKLKESSSLGITPSHIQDTLSLPYNDTAVLARTLEQNKQDIACVIVEPVSGNMGVVCPRGDFLKTLRTLTKKYNIVLIFDEIMTGFRTNSGCVQSELGIIPDMTCLGKIIGGGFPIGAYGGRKDIMHHLAPLGGVYQAGTFSGNPVVISAGLATLKHLDAGFYKRLNQRAEQFAKTINQYFQTNHIPAYLSHYKSMMSIRFHSQDVNNYEEAQAASSQKSYAQLFQKLLSESIYWPPVDLEAFFVSGKHTSKDLAKLSKVIQGFFHSV